MIGPPSTNLDPLHRFDPAFAVPYTSTHPPRGRGGQSTIGLRSLLNASFTRVQGEATKRACVSASPSIQIVCEPVNGAAKHTPPSTMLARSASPVQAAACVSRVYRGREDVDQRQGFDRPRIHSSRPGHSSSQTVKSLQPVGEFYKSAPRRALRILTAPLVVSRQHGQRQSPQDISRHSRRRCRARASCSHSPLHSRSGKEGAREALPDGGAPPAEAGATSPGPPSSLPSHTE